jgi:hypothetical protein
MPCVSHAVWGYSSSNQTLLLTPHMTGTPRRCCCYNIPSHRAL